jgi:hypothetical protein
MHTLLADPLELLLLITVLRHPPALLQILPSFLRNSHLLRQILPVPCCAILPLLDAFLLR